MKLQIHRFESEKSKIAFSGSKIYNLWAQQPVHDLLIPVCHSCPCGLRPSHSLRGTNIFHACDHTHDQKLEGEEEIEKKSNCQTSFYIFFVISLWRMIRHKEQKGKKHFNMFFLVLSGVSCIHSRGLCSLYEVLYSKHLKVFSPMHSIFNGIKLMVGHFTEVIRKVT